MGSKEFNLLHEPWILVLNDDGSSEQIGMIDLFRRAHKIKMLAGEMPTQDVAVFRVMLAVVYSVYLHKDADGNDAEIAGKDEALERWTSVWNKGKFDEGLFTEYLKRYEDRFYLFDDKRPFFQAKIDKGTEYSSAKLNGELSESGNKPRLFTNIGIKEKEAMEYPEAARWLIHLNAFDDTSAKPTVRGAGLPSAGAGWLGKMGLIFAQGQNLFETLMLNMVLLDRNEEPFGEGKAIWEKDTPCFDERVEIMLPENPVELLTLQSRRLLLIREGRLVKGYLLQGGDIVKKENALTEQMTVWRLNDDSEWVPKRHDPSKSVWRDYSALMSKGEGSMMPGVVRWTSLLEAEGCLTHKFMVFRITGIEYGDKDFYVNDTIDDSISLNSKMLSAIGESWNIRINNVLAITDKCVRAVGQFAIDLVKLDGNSDENGYKRAAYNARAATYYALDQPFRNWLHSIDPDADDMEIKMNEWLKITENTVLSAGFRMMQDSGEKAFVGRDMEKNSNSKYRLFKNVVYKNLRGE